MLRLRIDFLCLPETIDFNAEDSASGRTLRRRGGSGRGIGEAKSDVRIGETDKLRHCVKNRKTESLWDFPRRRIFPMQRTNTWATPTVELTTLVYALLLCTFLNHYILTTVLLN